MGIFNGLPTLFDNGARENQLPAIEEELHLVAGLGATRLIGNLVV